MGSQKSSGDHFLGAVCDEKSHGDLRFSLFCRPYTVIKLQSQTPCMLWHYPVIFGVKPYSNSEGLLRTAVSRSSVCVQRAAR